MKFRTEPIDQEVAIQDHPYYQAALDHLLESKPKDLISMEQTGTLADYLLRLTAQGMQMHLDLLDQGLRRPEIQERVMAEVIAPPPADLVEENALVEQSALAAHRRFLNKSRNDEPLYLPID